MKRLLPIALAACGHGNAGSFVQSATIDHHDLVITECMLGTEGEKIVASNCATHREKLPVIVVPAEPTESPGLETSEVAEGIAPVRAAVEQCARDRAITDVVRLRITIAPSGRVDSVVPMIEREGYDECVTTAFADARFPKTRTGAALTFSVVAP